MNQTSPLSRAFPVGMPEFVLDELPDKQRVFVEQYLSKPDIQAAIEVRLAELKRCRPTTCLCVLPNRCVAQGNSTQAHCGQDHVEREDWHTENRSRRLF